MEIHFITMENELRQLTPELHPERSPGAELFRYAEWPNPSYSEPHGKTENDETDGGTALVWASRNGHTEIVYHLLSKGADIEARGNDGGTALVWASRNGHAEIVYHLLSKGANIETKGPHVDVISLQKVSDSENVLGTPPATSLSGTVDRTEKAAMENRFEEHDQRLRRLENIVKIDITGIPAQSLPSSLIIDKTHHFSTNLSSYPHLLKIPPHNPHNPQNLNLQ